MTWANYDDVQRQLVDAGLILQGGIEVNTLKPVRCLVEGGDREKRGWYWLNDILLDRTAPDGAVMKLLFIVGGYGVYRGNDNGKTKIELPKSESKSLTTDQRAAIKARQDENIKRMAATQRAAADRAAQRAQRVWSKCVAEGESGYLARKQIQPIAVRFTPGGAVVVPMCDAAGKIHGLQFILDRANRKHARRIAQTGRDKEYWPKHLVKQGHYCLLGGLPVSVVLIAEGYATAGSLHAATGLPVAVAFDAGNLLLVAQALHKRYARAHILLCADDDYLTKCHALVDGKKCGTYSLASAGVCRSCGAPLSAGNAGITQASAAALAVRGEWLAPRFTAPRPVDAKGVTDFNDLHLSEGLHLVRAQVDAKIEAMGWRVSEAAGGAATKGGAGKDDFNGQRPAARSVMPLDDLVERFVPIDDGTGKYLFDGWTRKIVHRDQMAALLPPGMRGDDVKRHHIWVTRGSYYLDQVGFDPSDKDPSVLLNTWRGWPMQPKAGSCERLLELLEYLCGDEGNGAAISRWVLKWMAYPLQHPGAKMHSAIIMHGPQGTGKSATFRAYAKIYGCYATVLNQRGLEDKFNSDWSDSKLFILAEEVVTRAEMWHIKNELKDLVTGDELRVNPKNIAAYKQKNQINFVFLSNENQPLPLENDDRRHCVIYTPPALNYQFYDEVFSELENGGYEAFYHYLLNLDLGDFKTNTKPPMTEAKQNLINLSLPSDQRFIKDWISGDTQWPVMPCLFMDLYAAYQRWCRLNGEFRTRSSSQFSSAVDHLRGWLKKKYRVYGDCHFVGPTKQKLMLVPPENIMQAEGKEKPVAKSETIWLTESYLEFASVVREDGKWSN